MGETLCSIKLNRIKLTTSAIRTAEMTICPIFLWSIFTDSNTGTTIATEDEMNIVPTTMLVSHE